MQFLSCELLWKWQLCLFYFSYRRLMKIKREHRKLIIKVKIFGTTLTTGFIEFVCIHTETGIQLENLLEKYRHQHEIRQKSVKLLFTGLPRAGKTVLKKRLLRVIKNLISSGVVTPSEGFEKPISIIMESDVNWLHQHDLLDEAQTVLELIDQQSTTHHPPPSTKFSSKQVSSTHHPVSPPQVPRWYFSCVSCCWMQASPALEEIPPTSSGMHTCMTANEKW